MKGIYELRKAYGLTQKQLSDYTGIPKRTIENWEGGKRSPSDWVVKLIRHYLETTLTKEENIMKTTNIAQETMNNIASYMDDDIREAVHAELAPCSPMEFLQRYLELAPDFRELLESEFDIEI